MRSSPAAARNKGPIRDVLARLLPARARVLEIASGGGEHAVFLAGGLDVSLWQPSDPDATSRASIDDWRADDPNAPVRPAIDLDVTRKPWPVELAAPGGAAFDAIVCINMIHISPWEATEALLDGAAEILAPGAVLYLYGPYKRGGAHTAPSNAEFDASLRSRDARWGVRDLDEVVARARDFTLEEVVEMPANNLSVVLRRAQR